MTRAEIGVLKHTAATLLMVLLAGLSGCTKVNSGVGGVFNFDTDLKVILDVKEDINPDENHTPSPVYLRFYELTDERLFNRADFLTLYEQDEQYLGDNLISKQEMTRLAPGEARTEQFVIDPQAKYVALFAEFFQYKNAQFKVLFPITSNNIIENSVRIEVSENNLFLRSLR